MTSTCAFRTVILAVVFAVLAVPAAAQHDHDGESGTDEDNLPESFREPIQLYPSALGDHTHAISSSNAEAQAYFNQGFQLMYAFAKEDSTRSFREAWKRDPDCAICYWGEAWSWGSYLNGPMRPFEAVHAYAAMQAAAARLDHANAVERAYIESLRPRYVEDFDPEKRRDQDEAYADAMRRLAEAYPDDLDAVTLYMPTRYFCWSRGAAHVT